MPKIENNETLYSGPGKLCYDQLLPNLTQHSSLATLAPSAIFLPEDNAALLGLRPRRATDREVGLRGACQRPDITYTKRVILYPKTIKIVWVCRSPIGHSISSQK